MAQWHSDDERREKRKAGLAARAGFAEITDANRAAPVAARSAQAWGSAAVNESEANRTNCGGGRSGAHPHL
ncbi:MAG TPA: hypothetical protein VGA61_07155 [Anaerolineae bacterium]